MRHFELGKDEDLSAAVRETARGPLIVREGGEDIAVVISAAEYRRLQENAPDSEVRRLHEESVQRFSKVYEALAK